MASALGASTMQSSFMGAGLRARGGAFTARVSAPRSVAVRAGFNNMVKLGGGKKWERQELTPNGKPVKITMHVKKGDIVQVVARMGCGVGWHRVRTAPRGAGGLLRAHTSTQASTRLG
jgi:large subunit ribosomal protein L24